MRHRHRVMPVRRRAACLCLLCLAMLLGGCWNRTEIEDTAYIASIGVDAAESDYLWSFRIVQAENLPLGMLSPPPTHGKGGGTALIRVRATSLDSAVYMAQAGTHRILSLDQLRYVVFGEELARQGLGPVVEQLTDHYQVRPGVGVAVVMGTAYDAFSAFQPGGDLNQVKVNEGMLLVQKRLHMSAPIRLQHFFTRLLASGVDPIMPLNAINPHATAAPSGPLPSPVGRSLHAGEFPRNGGNPLETAGTAVFRADRLVGTLTVDETHWLLALRGEHGKTYGTLQDPKDPSKVITLRFGQENRPKYQTSFVQGRPVVHVKLQMDAEIVANTGETDYSSPENRRLLETAIDRRLQQQLPEMIAKIYGEWGADPVGFGLLFRRQFPTFKAWLAYDWSRHQRDLQFSVEQQLFIRRFGLSLGRTTSGVEER